MFKGPQLTFILIVTIFIITFNSIRVNCLHLDEKALLQWNPPEGMYEKFPYMLTGYSKQGFPVWVVQYGKWDVRNYLENSHLKNNSDSDIDHYIDQMILRWTLSPKLYGTPLDLFTFILDVKGFDDNQFLHLPSVQKFLDMMNKLVVAVEKTTNLKKAIIINSNDTFNKLWNFVKPFLGSSFTDRVNVFNVDENWKLSLIKQISKEELPDFLGGTKHHIPIHVYG